MPEPKYAVSVVIENGESGGCQMIDAGMTAWDNKKLEKLKNFDYRNFGNVHLKFNTKPGREWERGKRVRNMNLKNDLSTCNINKRNWEIWQEV